MADIVEPARTAAEACQQPINTTASRREQFTLERLTVEIGWYDSRSRLNRLLFKALKTATMTAAAIIPVVATSGAHYGGQVAGVLGILIAVLEAIQELNQYRANWTTYRSTAEALKQQKYLYLGNAGTYNGTANPSALLAERIEMIMSRENAKWLARQTQANSGPTQSRES